MWKNIAEWLELTKTERRVILFLSLVFILGAGLRLLKLSQPEMLKFDYRASDSTFVASSAVAEDSLIQKNEEEPLKNYGQLNINSATRDQFVALPGIGTATADRIIALRSELGKFKTIEDLRGVKGISKKKFEKLAPMITVH